MRRLTSAREPAARSRLAFEPLEPRELLAADAGAEWWSSWNVPADDWTWNFDDSWSVADPRGADAGGEASGDDGWWVGDVSWDGADSAGSDWAAGVGGDDPAWTWTGDQGVDVVEPPAFEPPAGGTGGPAIPAVDVVSAPHPAEPNPTITVVATPPVATPPVIPPPIAGPVEPPVQIVNVGAPAPTVDESVGDPAAIVTDVATDGVAFDVGADVQVELPIDVKPDGSVEPEIHDVVDGGDERWVIDAPPVDVGAPELVDDPAADEQVVVAPVSVTDVVVDVTTIDPVPTPPTVIVTPVATGPVQPVVVPAPAAAAAADRFAGWGGFFFQAFGRQAGAADGIPTSGQADGSTGTARPRIRLPFRPVV